MSQLPTYWFRTEYFWISERSVLVCFSHLPHCPQRLSTLGHVARTQALSTHASSLLVPATHRSSSSPRKTAQRLP